MKVFELIKELKKCPQDSIVMYNFENSYDNEVNGVENNYGFDVLAEHREFEMGIDDVLVGSGTLKGFVFLTENLTDIRGEDE
jgi:hypothetical protein